MIVHYSGRNRLALHVDEMVDGEIAGTKIARRGAVVEIGPGRNEVGDDFWNAWSEQHKGSGLHGLLRVEKPDQERSDNGVVSTEDQPKPVQ